MGALLDLIHALATALQGFQQQMKPAQESASALQTMKPLLERMVVNLASIDSTLKRVAGHLTGSAVSLPEVQIPGDKALGAVGGAAALAGPWGQVGSMATSIAQSLKQFGEELINLVPRFVAWARPFVEALSPGTMERFAQAWRNLMAAVGRAFEPVFQVLARVFDQINGILTPLMARLRPVVERVAQALGGAFVAAVEAAGEALAAALPFLAVAAEIVAGLAQIGKALFQIVSAVFRGLQGADFGDTLKRLRTMFQQVAEALLIFAARMAVIFHLTDFLKNLIDVVRGDGRHGPGTYAAVQNTSVQDYAAIARQLAEAAAAAAGTEGQPEATLSNVLDVLKSIQAGNDQGRPQLLTMIEDIRNFIARVEKGVGNTVEQIRTLPQRIANLLPHLPSL